MNGDLLKFVAAMHYIVMGLIVPVVLGIFVQVTKRREEPYLPQIPIWGTSMVLIGSMVLLGILRWKVSFQGWNRGVHVITLLVIPISWITFLVQLCQVYDGLRFVVVMYFFASMGSIFIIGYNEMAPLQKRMMGVAIFIWPIISSVMTHVALSPITRESILASFFVAEIYLMQIIYNCFTLKTESNSGADALVYLHWYYIVTMTFGFGLIVFVKWWQPTEETETHNGLTRV